MGPTGRPRQGDIARHADVSQSTVSIVLNGKASERGISQITQEKIRAAVAELGYVPDVAARSLRGSRNGLIGVHTFERVFPVGPGDYYHEFLVGIEEKVVESAQDLLLLGSTRRPDGTRSLYDGKSNRMRLADGAVILGLERNDAELERLAEEGFPFVIIGRHRLRDFLVPFVAADYASATADAVDSLREHGHRRLGYLGMSVRRTPQAERLEAFDRNVALAGMTSAPPDFRRPESVDETWLGQLLDAGVTALVVESCELTDAVAGAADRFGLDVPADLSVVSLDTPMEGSPTAAWSHTPVPRREMGARAVAVLLDLLDGVLPSSHEEIVPCGPLTPGSIVAPR